MYIEKKFERLNVNEWEFGVFGRKIFGMDIFWVG